MRRFRTTLGSMAVALAVTAGCDTAPPGGGFTNGPAPDLTADKASVRTDAPDRDRTDQGELKGAGGLATMPDGGGMKDSGTGGKGGNSGEFPAKATAPKSSDARTDTVGQAGSASAQPPSNKEGTGANSAAGGTKPSGDIKVGTPKSPQ